jgi:predicted extracellular nuclease
MKTKIGFVNLLMASVLALTAILGGIMPKQIVQAYTTDSLIFINEIHYDNVDTDANEAVEIAGPAGTDLTGWSIVLYNGSGGGVYDTDSLNVTLTDSGNGYGFTTITYPSNGIQNGSPDGIALVKPDDTVVLFLSYEGSFTAVGGPADGLTSTDIGVTEGSSTLINQSLQLSGTGDSYLDFTWQTPATATPGAVNNNQVFSTVSTDPKINEFSASTTGTDVEYVEIFGEPNTNYSALTILEIEGDSGTTLGVIDEVIAVGTTDTNGFYLADLAANTLENGTITILLVENFTGAFEDDLDTNDDGIFDSTPWDSIVDSVSVNDGGTGDITYGEPVLTVSYDGLSFAPGGASRIPDGTDTEATSDWVRNDFDLAGIDGFTGSIGLGEAYNTPGESNLIYTPPPEACGDPYTPIFTIQGNGLASTLDGTEVATEGVVVGDFQVGGKNGFYLQDPVGDGDTSTSDGIFVYYTGLDVNVGEHVRVRGFVDEYFELTEITSVSQAWYCGAGDPVAPTALLLPVNDVNDFEAYENMLVTFPQELIISEYFNFDRFGEIVLTSHRHLTPTALFEPGSPEQAAMAEFYLLDRITLDDGRTNQNPDPAIHPNGDVFDMNNLFRGGDLVTNVTGVLDYNFSLWKIQPTQGADYTSMNPRTATPEDVGGRIKVASFNVLNYFSTIDDSGNICGPNEDMECRGADTTAEFTRQRDKIFTALALMDADVVGLMEIENHVSDAAVMNLIDGLNSVVGAGTYDYIDTGVIGADAIKVALIYKTATVVPIGNFAILDSSVDARFIDSKNRPTLAQTFEEIATGETVTVAVNHLKSKGSACDDVGDPDLGDGAGNCNLTRKTAAEAMVDWLAADPTGTGSMNTLIIGDLNSYDKEDPIDAILAGADDLSGTSDDYLDLIYTFVGETAYGYVFDGQVGYLDSALANKHLFSQITGTTIWHINADEPDLIDYDMTFKADAQDALYAADQFRSSDHDPVIIGLDLKTYQFFLPIINK